MLRVAVLRALAIAAVFAVVWLVPLRAYAAIVPVCDDDGGSVATSAAAPAVDCAAPLDPLDDLDPEVAAMCDERGATAVAPGRIHPETDARIDAVVTCDGRDLGPALGASHGEQNPASFVATVPDAMLSASFDLRPAFAVELPAFPPVEGAPLRGVRREIDRPPCA
ncbi:hypothetical protein [Polyangium spumosum]|uniref:Uncharacterized protein n=1 Tax=Polyangium spumosum TaxID=889282 RepID=A0A6N7PNA4_9BACT|nr:hypothetical protein [Polyangium spumosum]MRG91595.1 hypothetical protein [Polyangium spumosum]